MDPLTISQLALPTTVPQPVYTRHGTLSDLIMKRIACLVLVAFYFLFQVREYTKPCFVARNGKISMQPAHKNVVGNIGVFKDGVDISHSSTGKILQTVDLAVTKLSN